MIPQTSYIEPGLFDGAGAVRDWPFAGLEPMAYDFIMADPPWRFELRSEEGEEKSAQAHYETMDLDAIAALPVADLAAQDCLLWLWATAPMLDQQVELMRRWGFKFKSAGAWNKRRWGPGYVWRGLAEFILLGTRGEPSICGKAVPNFIEESRREHSRKPDRAYAMAEKMMPHARRASLFERPIRQGWEGWGNEYGQTIEPGRRAKARKATAPAAAPVLI
jgi:N6-adenosine-specific RNA methylase IME4